MVYRHIPVMLKDAVEILEIKDGGIYIDGTLGGGGYAFELAKRAGAKGKVLAIDLDELAINNAEEKIKKEKFENIILTRDNFAKLKEIAKRELGEDAKADGIVLDLGLSSAQLADRSRGFSFSADTALEMAFSQNESGRTREIVNRYSEEELERIFRDYGEERFSRRIAGAIAAERKNGPIDTTGRLVSIISGAIPALARRGKIHFATKVFQALRIATNGELENLRQALESALKILKSGGRIAIVSYHSLEDRLVKNFFRREAGDCLCPPSAPVCVCGHRASLKVLTKKPLSPSPEEIKNNPRARSAKLRAAEKI